MILVNGVVADSLAVADRGLAYGDGVFRTLLSSGGTPRYWERHFRKLGRDCRALAIPCPAEPVLAGEAGRVARAGGGVLKIIVTRGGGARGYAPPRAPEPTRIVMGGDLPRHPPEFSRDGVRVRFCDTRLSRQPRLAGVKHLNRLENVLARAEWDDPSVAEGLMADEAGNIIGGTMTNLFIVENGCLVTPELSHCGVAGVARERVMEAAAASGTPCREESISMARLQDAEEAMLVNSVIGVWRILACGKHRWRPGTQVERVREWLDGD